HDLHGKTAEVAHEMVVADGTLEAYEAYEALFAQSQFAPEVREWVIRQRKMLAWDEAVTINTAASYRSFLVQYPDTDLTLTARTLIQRLRFKPSPLPQVAALCTPPVTPSAPSAPTLKKADLTPTQAPVVIHEREPVIIKKVTVTTPPREIDPPVRHPPPHEPPVHQLPPRQ